MGQGIAVDTELRTNPPRFPWLWLARTDRHRRHGRSRRDQLPVDARRRSRSTTARTACPTGWQPSRWAPPFSLVFVQIGVTALLVGIAAAIFRSRPDLDPARPLASARWYRQYMSLGAKALLGLVAMIDLGMLGSSLLMWTGTVTPWAPTGGRAPDPGRRRGGRRGPGQEQPRAR